MYHSLYLSMQKWQPWNKKHFKVPQIKASLRKDLKVDAGLIGLMSFGSLFQSFGHLSVLRRSEIKIQEEAECQSLSVEMHAGTCGRDPKKQKPIQWCSLGSWERFVFISSCKCILTGRSCYTIMIQDKASESHCVRANVLQWRCQPRSSATLTLFVTSGWQLSMAWPECTWKE